MVREGVRKLLEEQTSFRVIGESGDGLEAIAQVEKLKPEVLVVDIMLPGLNGLEVVRVVRQRSPQTRVIVLSMHASEAYVVEALRNGASGYVLKESSGIELIRAIQAVIEGTRYLSPSLAERALDAYIENMGQAINDPYDMLTERERQVLHLAAEGQSNAAIAERLSIGVRTVETHRSNLLHKLSLKNQHELVRYAIQRGILK